MKIVFREWRKDPTACAMIMVWFAISVIYTVLNARVVILISNVFSSLNNWKYHLSILLVVCAIQTALSMLRGILRPLSVHHCFGTLNSLYADKVLDSDVQMFTKYSCSYINTMSEFIFRIAGAGINFIRFLLDIVNVVVLLVSIWMVGGTMVIPVIIVYGFGAIWARKLFREYEKLDKAADEIKKKRNQELENIVNGFMEVRSFSTQEHHRRVIKDFNDAIYDGRKKRSKVQSITNFSFETVDTAGLVVVIIYSIRQMALGIISQAEAMSLVVLVFRIIEPLGAIMDFMDTFSQDISMAESYEKIVNYINRNAQIGRAHV